MKMFGMNDMILATRFFQSRDIDELREALEVSVPPRTRGSLELENKYHGRVFEEQDLPCAYDTPSNEGRHLSAYPGYKTA